MICITYINEHLLKIHLRKVYEENNMNILMTYDYVGK